MNILWVESRHEFLDCLITFFEASHRCAIARIHQFRKNQNSMLMFSQRIESLIEKFPELPKLFRLDSSKCIDIFMSQLKGNFLLKLDPFPRHATQEEAEINMYKSPIPFYHNVLIMSIFYL